MQPPKARRRSADVEAVDPDIETVGRVLEGVRLYVFGALFFLSTAVSLVLVQVHLLCTCSGACMHVASDGRS